MAVPLGSGMGCCPLCYHFRGGGNKERFRNRPPDFAESARRALISNLWNSVRQGAEQGQEARMSAWRIGRAYGINIYLHWTMLLLPLWILLTQPEGAAGFTLVLTGALF